MQAVPADPKQAAPVPTHLCVGPNDFETRPVLVQKRGLLVTCGPQSHGVIIGVYTVIPETETLSFTL